MRKPIPTRRASKRQENKVAKMTGGKVQPNSGATDFLKGDLVVNELDLLIECKTVMKEKQSFSIKKEWLLTNERERFAQKKSYSGLVFDFGDNQDQYIVMDLKQFMKLVKEQSHEPE